MINNNTVYANCYAGMAFNYEPSSPGVKETKCIISVNSQKLPNPNSENFKKEFANFNKKLMSILSSCKFASKGLKFFRWDIYEKTAQDMYRLATSYGNCGVDLFFYVSKDGRSCRYASYQSKS